MEANVKLPLIWETKTIINLTQNLLPYAGLKVVSIFTYREERPPKH